MIKLVCFVKRKPGMDRDAFHSHWLESHGPLIERTPDLANFILRYEQNHRLDVDYDRDPDGFDGVTMQWFHSMNDFVGFCKCSAYAELIAPDEARFLDRSAFGLIFAGPANRLIIDRAAMDGSRVKLLCLLKRQPQLTAEQFHAHWRDPHGPLFRDTPELSRHIAGYEQHPRLIDDYVREKGAGFDGLAEQWYADVETFNRYVAEPAQREIIMPDEDRFIDRPSIKWVLTGAADIIISGPERSDLEAETFE